MSRHVAGALLVAAQLSAMAALGLWALPPLAAARAPWPAWALLAAAVALGAWALAANRPGNFNIRPTPREGARLVDTGPYRWIRHPMYSAVMAGALGCLLAAPGVVTAFALALLVPVLVVKAMLEERWMAERHPGYRAYMARTRRFVPGLL